MKKERQFCFTIVLSKCLKTSQLIKETPLTFTWDEEGEAVTYTSTGHMWGLFPQLFKLPYRGQRMAGNWYDLQTQRMQSFFKSRTPRTETPFFPSNSQDKGERLKPLGWEDQSHDSIILKDTSDSVKPLVWRVALAIHRGFQDWIAARMTAT